MNTKTKVVAYKTKNGRVPFFEWLDAFKDKITRARINRQLERLEEGTRRF